MKEHDTRVLGRLLAVEEIRHVSGGGDGNQTSTPGYDTSTNGETDSMCDSGSQNDVTDYRTDTRICDDRDIWPPVPADTPP